MLGRADRRVPNNDFASLPGWASIGCAQPTKNQERIFSKLPTIGAIYSHPTPHDCITFWTWEVNLLSRQAAHWW
jgi:hypothetical protein